MRFRPCIDIHNGKVKQIVGGTLNDMGDTARENFISEKGAAFFAEYYKKKGLTGGHIILLNAKDSPFYEATKKEALEALAAYPGGLQIGGGITPDNAREYLEAGASHVIVTSYVFKDGIINWKRLEEISEAAGRKKLVLDLSCRKKDGRYYIVTDRWQKFTNEELTTELMFRLYRYCDEFLIHAVDVEGKSAGIEQQVAKLLSEWDECPVTYAGGVGRMEDLEKLKELTGGRTDVTIGSALDIFGGNIEFEKVLEFMKR